MPPPVPVLDEEPVAPLAPLVVDPEFVAGPPSVPVLPVPCEVVDPVEPLEPVPPEVPAVCAKTAAGATLSATVSSAIIITFFVTNSPICLS